MTPYRSGDFRLTYSLCLSVTVLRIEETGGFSDMDLVSLMALDNLRELKIYADSNKHNQIQSKITFDGGCGSTFESYWYSLTSDSQYLLLNSVNTRSIIVCCPKLVHKNCLITKLKSHAYSCNLNYLSQKDYPLKAIRGF
jgi:hypothetical protein